MFTLSENESDTKTKKKMACVKLYGSVHTDPDPLTIKFHGVGNVEVFTVTDSALEIEMNGGVRESDWVSVMNQKFTVLGMAQHD